MKSVGVRELRQRASELLRRVEAGETFEITDRGRPVAVLIAVPSERDGLAKLRATGQLEQEAMGSFDDLPEPLVLPDGAMTASEALASLRADER